MICQKFLSTLYVLLTIIIFGLLNKGYVGLHVNGGNCIKKQNIDFPPLQLANMFPTTNDLVPDDLTVYMLQLIFYLR